MIEKVKNIKKKLWYLFRVIYGDRRYGKVDWRSFMLMHGFGLSAGILISSLLYLGMKEFVDVFYMLGLILCFVWFLFWLWAASVFYCIGVRGSWTLDTSVP